jgi:ABC-type dipeptide/oligopeptide/nickel transport system permease component
VHRRGAGALLGATLILAGTALVLCSIFGLIAGVVSAVRQYGWTDRIVTFFVLIGISTPSFWLGLLLILSSRSSCAGCRPAACRDLWRRRPARPAHGT